jgi:sensor histidine kinase regulating citrate/malate metabolism
VAGCKSEGTGLIFQVHNEGIIPREIQLQLFQRSFSTKGKGRGIGTYSIRLLVENYLKGKVTFVSNEDCGTNFSVEIRKDF